MIERLRLWYLALSRREQILIGIAAALALVTLFWGVEVVLLGTMQSAHTRHADAVRRLADTEARVRAVQAETRSPRAAPGGTLDAVVRDKAQAVGFQLSSDNAQADGSVDIAIASARPPALFAWVASLEQEGLIVRRFAATDNGDRTLAVQMTIKKRGS